MSFTVGVITDENELNQIYRLRFKVYCLEWGHEKFENHPDEIITDAYDRHSVHIAVKEDETQKIIGAVSLILDSPEGFMTEKYCELDIDRNTIPRGNLAEIAKLVVHRNYRRRSEDKYIYGPDEERRNIGNVHAPGNYSNNSHFRRADDRFRFKGGRRQGGSNGERRSRHEVVINLYKALYHESKRRGITHWYAIMTKGIMLFLGKFGLKFQAIGDPVDYNGIRTPYLGEIAVIEKGMSRHHSGLYEEFIRDM